MATTLWIASALVATLVALACGGLFSFWLWHSVSRLRVNEHAQANALQAQGLILEEQRQLIREQARLLVEMARHMRLDTHRMERALVDSGENL